MTESRGLTLARLALEVFLKRAASYPDGITIQDLDRELRLADQEVPSNPSNTTLRNALNGSMRYGVWAQGGRGLWTPGDGKSKMEDGLSGRDLAEALYWFVKGRWPGGVFDHTEARLALERTGVNVKGTGSMLRNAPDLFEPLPGRGKWRWK